MRDAEIVYSALSLTDLIAWIATRLSGGPKLVWGVRAGSVPEHWKLRWPFELSRMLSGSVPLVITNSGQGLRFLRDAGFRAPRMVVIPNGIDTNLFRYDAEARSRIRREWHIEDSHQLVGIVGRATREKGYEDFLRAARLVQDRCAQVRFVSVGGGAERYRRELRKMSNNLGLDEVMLWAGERRDLPAVYSATGYLLFGVQYGGVSERFGPRPFVVDCRAWQPTSAIRVRSLPTIH